MRIIGTNGRGRPGRRRGNAVLDMALVMPILLYLAFGTVEFGYYFYVKHTLQGAAREGCRASIVSGASASDVTTAVSNVMTAAGFSASKYNSPTVTPSGWASASSGTAITVTVQSTWGTIGIKPSMMIGSAKVVAGSAVMRKE